MKLANFAGLALGLVTAMASGAPAVSADLLIMVTPRIETARSDTPKSNTVGGYKSVTVGRRKASGRRTYAMRIKMRQMRIRPAARLRRR